MKKFTLAFFAYVCLFSAQAWAVANCNPEQILTLESLDGDDVDDQETLLYNLVNEYRAENGLAAIPLSTSLSLVANRHIRDAYENTGTLNYGWSNCLFSGQGQTVFSCMWNAPQRLGTSYLGSGYEIIYATPDGSEVIPSEALNSWKQNSGKSILLNQSGWSNASWNALGVGIYQGYAVLWLGKEVDSKPTAVTSTQENKILELYSAYFNRAADQGGFNHWRDSFSGYTGGGNPEKEETALQKITLEMATSPEYLDLYPSTQSSTDFINAIYTNLLGRDPDAEGLAFWVKHLDEKTMSKEQAILKMIAGSKANCTAQGLADSALINNKTRFSKYLVNSQKSFDPSLVEEERKKITCDPVSITIALKPIISNHSSAIFSERKWLSSDISVCWENPTPENEYYRNLVIRSVEETWVKYSAVKFTGWEQCTNSVSDIKIAFKDEQPRVKVLGNKLRNRPEGMILNYEFNQWDHGCKENKEFCLKAHTVHEFGHALAFVHEQDRQDSPDWCKDPVVTPNAEVTGPWDESSVMNYCNGKVNNSGELSEFDIFAVQKHYGYPASLNSCN